MAFYLSLILNVNATPICDGELSRALTFTICWLARTLGSAVRECAQRSGTISTDQVQGIKYVASAAASLTRYLVVDESWAKLSVSDGR
jgi:hypothetical protein